MTMEIAAESAEFPLKLYDAKTHANVETVHSTFEAAGFKRNEARILVYLMAKGPSSSRTIGNALGIQRTETYNYLDSLQKKNTIEMIPGRPTLFRALPLSDIMQTVMIENREKVASFSRCLPLIENIKEQIVANTEVPEENGTMQFLSGSSSIMSKMHNLVKAAKDGIMVVTGTRYLLKMHNEQITDDLMSGKLKVGLKTSSDEIHKTIIIDKKHANVFIKKIETLAPMTFIIKDSDAVLAVFDEELSSVSSAIYTTNRNLVNLFKFIYALCH